MDDTTEDEDNNTKDENDIKRCYLGNYVHVSILICGYFKKPVIYFYPSELI